MFSTDARLTERDPAAAGTATLSSVVALDGRSDAFLLGIVAEHLRRLNDEATAANLDTDGVVVGRASLFERLSLPVDRLGDWPQRLERRGETVLFVAIDGRTAGLVGIAPASIGSPNTDSL